jgi:hypothetical protein
MIPPEEVVRRKLFALERRLNRDGWDQPPALYTMHCEGRNVAIEPRPGSFPNAGAYVHSLADIFENHAAGRTLARTLATPSFAGFAVDCESWQYHGNMPPEKRNGRKLADIPGSVECRDVMAVDVGGRLHWVSRIRGQQPYEPPYAHGGMLSMSGRMVVALRSMTLSVAKLMPFGTADLDALRSEEPFSTVPRAEPATTQE